MAENDEKTNVAARGDGVDGYRQGEDTMKERPILFSGPMVRAILTGTKTQTRRVVKPQPVAIETVAGAIWEWDAPGGDTVHMDSEPELYAPYKLGHRLWVRETWWHYKSAELEQAAFQGCTVANLDGKGSRPNCNAEFDPSKHKIWRKRPSIHMPRWACRLVLEITAVRVERLQEISEEDARAEGADPYNWQYDNGEGPESYREAFRCLWGSINGVESWDANPWVWCIEFKRIEAAAVAGEARS